MNKIFRLLIVIILFTTIIILAKDKVAWAEPTSSADLSSLAQDDASSLPVKSDRGSVKPPPGQVIIPGPDGGTYSIGGICTITVEYKSLGLSDKIYLEVPVKKSRSVPFPESYGKIHLPGCHVLHYFEGQITSEMSTNDGTWTICFAARPKKTTTIYYYLDTLESLTPTWIPLETTVENGIACAPANYSGVYAPASK